VTTNEPPPLTEQTANIPERFPDTYDWRPATVTQPDNPFRELFLALAAWAASVAFLLFVPLLAAVPYVIYKSSTQPAIRPESLLADKTFIILSLLSVIPAHILTLGVIWAVVTAGGKRPFWETLGWSWPPDFGPWKSIACAIVLLTIGLFLTYMLDGPETQLDLLIKSSYAARLVTAFLAVTTGPLVEELIYRGVLFSAFQRVMGVVWAVVVVSVMFVAVHVYQYYNNLGVIAVIAMLSISLTLVRAYTGSLLPCFVMHVVFNGIQSIYLVIQPYLEKLQHTGDQKAAVIEVAEFVVRHLG
jgi:CAAX protease family protein